MSDTENIKLPPQSIEAEMSILGGVLINKDAIKTVRELLSPDDFYREAHRKIFSGMLELSKRGEPCDLITLTETLKLRGDIEASGGASYLVTLVDYVTTSTDIACCCKIVKEKAINRRLITVATEILTKGYDDQANVNELLDGAQKSLFELSENKLRPQYICSSALAKEMAKRFQQRYEQPEPSIGVATGLSGLDRLTAGFQPGNLVIIAARPSMGKTTLAINIASHVGLESEDRRPVAFFSLEMSTAELMDRLTAGISKINCDRIRTGSFRDTDWPKIQKAVDMILKSKIFIDETPAISVRELRSRARRLKDEHGLGLVIVDNLQLMRGNASNYENRQQELSEISRSLKALAKELNVPVVVLSQLSQSLENRHDKRPVIIDLHESGTIEQDADVIMFVYREAVYCEYCRNKDGSCTSNHERSAELIIGKQRNGPIGTVKLTYMDKYGRFEN